MLADEAVELGIVRVDAAEFDDAFAHVGGEFVAERAARHADNGELLAAEDCDCQR